MNMISASMQKATGNKLTELVDTSVTFDPEQMRATDHSQPPNTPSSVTSLMELYQRMELSTDIDTYMEPPVS